MGELGNKLADARARSELDPSKLAQGKADLKPVVQETINSGPPFFNLSYCEKVLSKLPGDDDTFIKRFVAEVFKIFDSDKDGALSVEDVSELVKSMFAALEVPTLAARVIPDLCLLAEPGQTEAGGFKVSEQGFKTMFIELMKKAKFKMKAGGFGTASASSQGTAGYTAAAKAPGKIVSKFGGMSAALETPQECTDYPKGSKVEITAFRFIIATYAEGAKKMRLSKWKEEIGRKPRSKINLEVVGSYQYKGAPRDGLTTGMMMVGIRNPDDGEEYLCSVEGLKPYELDEETKAYRAKLAKEGMLNCTAVTDVSEQIKSDGVRLPDGTYIPGVPGSADAAGATKARVSFEEGKTENDAAVEEPLPMRKKSTMASNARKGTIKTPMNIPGSVAGEEDGIWFDEPYWLEAKFECSEADGLMDIAVGDWVWIQFQGTGESKGWLYGTDANGVIAGWIPGDIAGEDPAAVDAPAPTSFSAPAAEPDKEASAAEP